jgi:peptidoglycan/LPS O-acetylase OafA/YrhL
LMALMALLSYGLIMVWSYVSFAFLETPARRWIDHLPPFGRAARGPGHFAPESTSSLPPRAG